MRYSIDFTLWHNKITITCAEECVKEIIDLHSDVEVESPQYIDPTSHEDIDTCFLIRLVGYWRYDIDRQLGVFSCIPNGEDF